MSLAGGHHSGATPAAGPGAACWVPVQNHACRLFHEVTALVAPTAVSSSPPASPTATARMTSRVPASRPPLTASRSPSPTVPDPFIPERLASRSSVPTRLTVSPPYACLSCSCPARSRLPRSWCRPGERADHAGPPRSRSPRSWLCPGERADRAVPHDDLAVGVRGDPGVVGDQDDRGPLLADRAHQQVHHQLAG